MKPALSERAAPWLPAAATLAVLLLWAADDGGFPPDARYPGAIFLLSFLVVVLVAYPAVVRGLSLPTRLALAFLGLFALWAYVSISWADVPADAWDGANRTLLYLTLFTLFAMWPWRGTTAAAWAGLLAAGVAIVGLVVLLVSDGGDFVGGRLQEPAGYSNATCALFLVPFWPGVLLASRREVPVVARGILLAASGVLLEVSLLTQSRGFLVAFPLVLLLYVLLVPGRLRSLLSLVLVAGAVLAALAPLLAVFADEADAASLRAARLAVLLSAGGLFLAGAVVGLVDRRIEPEEGTLRVLRRVVVGLAAAGAVVVLAVGVAVVDRPGERVADAWAEFKSGEPDEFGSSHFIGGGLGSGRYDEWRVALDQFRSAPVHGIGMDNFAAPYLRERTTNLEPKYPHSFPLAVLSQTGLVGGLLVLGFLASALLAAARTMRRSDRFAAALAGAAVVGFAYWLVHGAADWFWEYPALGGAAFALLGLAAGLGREPPPPEKARSRPLLRLAGVGAASLVLLVGLASFAAPWLSAREVDRASRDWRTDTARAFAALDRARRLNPLTDRPDLVAGAIAMRLENYEDASAAFQRALERNPHGWYPHLELAMIEALGGRDRKALGELERARVLNPSEPVLEIVREWIREGERVDPAEIDRLLLDRVESRTGVKLGR